MCIVPKGMGGKVLTRQMSGLGLGGGAVALAALVGKGD